MASDSEPESKSVLVSIFGPTLSTPEGERAEADPVSPGSHITEMAVDSGTETKSVLVSLYGPTLGTSEDERVEADSVCLRRNKSNDGTDNTKSRPEAILGRAFNSESESSTASEEPDLSPPRSSSSTDNLLNPFGSICGSETLKKTTSSSRSTIVDLSPGLSSVGLVTTGYQIADEFSVRSTPVQKLVPSFENQSNERLESSSVGTGCQIADKITDEFTPVEELVSSLEDQCKEASETEQLIPVMQGVGNLQRRVRISRSEEGLSPTPDHSPRRPAGQDLSQIEHRLQDLTEKEAVSKEEFDAFRCEIIRILGRISDENRSHHKFQLQVHQRVVPRIILCSEGKVGTRQKLLKTLARGLKSVRLHMLCEQEGEEHKVLDVPGCKLHLKEGENWEGIYPFLNHGLRVFDLVTSAAMRMSVGGNPVPSTHAWLQEFHSKIVQPNRTYDTSQTPQAAAAQTAASQGAEQWVVRHLKGRNMVQDFGLQRMVFEKSGGSQPKGTIVWLCREHAENGKDSHLLTNLPTAG